MGPGFPQWGGFDIEQLMRLLQSSGPDVEQLMRLLQSSGPVNFDVAQQVASAIATANPETGSPEAEPTIEGGVATAFDGVVRAAQTAVAETTGIGESLAVPSRCVDRQGWSRTTLSGLAPVFEALATALRNSQVALGAEEADPDEPRSDQLFGMLMQQLLPLMLGVWAGSMVGQLSHHALGQYDLPLPLDGPPALLFVVRNVDHFSDEWSLPADEMRYALAMREAVHGAQRAVPWVRQRLVRLAADYVGGYEVRLDALEDLLGDVDFTNPESMQQLSEFGDAGALLGAMQSERQEPMLEELQRFVSVLEGYADVVVDTLGERMVSAHARIDEALRRHRLERGEVATFVDRLLGLELDRRHYDEGVAFCRGVVERAGLAGLNRIWEGEDKVPTRPEFEAPGLWLARIEL
jgi:putative hydrolase